MCRLLRARPEALYAVLDAARSPAIRPLLNSSGARHESLFSGAVADDLADHAPYLVDLSAKSASLDQLAAPMFAHSWGYFILSAAPFEELRTHLRKFLVVTFPEGREVYFRFYDPRVIRQFLPVATEDQALAFFKPIVGLLCAAQSADTAAIFRMAERRLVFSEFPIAPFSPTSIAAT